MWWCCGSVHGSIHDEKQVLTFSFPLDACILCIACCSSLFFAHCSFPNVLCPLFCLLCLLSFFFVSCSVFFVSCSFFFVCCRMDHLHHQPTWVENFPPGLHIEARLFPLFPARFGRSSALDRTHSSSGRRRFNRVVRLLPWCHLLGQIHVGQRCVFLFV